MSESTWLASSSGAAFSTASATRYLSLIGFNGVAAAYATTEAWAEFKLRTAATLRKFYVTVNSNARGTATVLTLRKNGADTSVTVSIGAGVTGVVSDTTNSATYADGDTACFSYVTSTGTGNLIITATGIEASSSGQAAVHLGITPSPAGISTSTGSTVNAYGIGDETGTTTGNEDRTNVRAMESCTLSNLQVYVSANARTTNTTFSSRKNSAAGAMSCVFGSGVTGFIEDTSNSDSLSAGDRFNFARETLTGGGAIVFRMMSLKYIGATANVSALVAGGTSETLAAATTTYYSPAGAANQGNEAGQRATAPIAGTVTKAGVYVGVNASTTDATFTFRVASADTSLAVTVTASTTGAFTDTTNTATVAAGDYLSWKGTGATTGAVTLGSFSTLFTAPAAAAGGAFVPPSFFAIPLLIR